MARKPNYDFDKRRKELDRKASKDKKLEERRLRRLAGPVADDLLEPLDGPVVEGEPVDGETAEIPGDQP